MGDQISRFLNERIAAGDFPSSVYLAAQKGEIKLCGAIGSAVVEPDQIPASTETIYDLASLTKVLLIGLLAAQSVEGNEIALSDPISRFFPHIDGPIASVTIEHLLTHTSGFEAWRPFYLFTPQTLSNPDRKISVRDQILARPLSGKPGISVTYSDLNFILLGFILEQIYAEEIGTRFASKIAKPLGLQNTFLGSTGLRKHDTAASENGNVYEKQTCRELFPNVAIPGALFREGTIWGEVHDGNAWFMGGLAGHAGLFSTVQDVFRIARQFLPASSEILKPETCGYFRKNFTAGSNEDRSFAFQLASTTGSTAGIEMSPETFGHTGFTGTSLWIDPLKERIFLLLSNRTHHHPLPFININSVRRQFHKLAIEFLES